jgi:hypothetical protein
MGFIRRVGWWRALGAAALCLGCGGVVSRTNGAGASGAAGATAPTAGAPTSAGGGPAAATGGATAASGGSGVVLIVGGAAGDAGTPACTRVSCTPSVGQYCGIIGDGCGNALDCGSCPSGLACGAELPGVCSPPLCTGLGCQVDESCPGGAHTEIAGTVYDPAGKVPLYNAQVYVPGSALSELSEGPSCEPCTPLPDDTVAEALSDTQGHFVLEDAPSGANIPVVVQVGKWRRQVTLPEVTPCVMNSYEDGLFRLPQNQTEGQLPQLAVTTGADALECFLRRVGVDSAEFTSESGTGHVQLYAGENGASALTTGAALSGIDALFNDATGLARYDDVLVSCAHDPAQARALPAASKSALKAYVDAGGVALLEHLAEAYLVAGDEPSPFPAIAMSWTGSGAAGATYPVVRDFPRGAAFAEWLFNVGASTTSGELALGVVDQAAVAVDPSLDVSSWLSSAGVTPLLSFPTPIDGPAAAQCGRVVHVAPHVAGGEDSAGLPFPSECLATELSPPEKALEFQLFSSVFCVFGTPVRPLPPAPPPPPLPGP